MLFTPVIYVIFGFHPCKIFGLICTLVKIKNPGIPSFPIQLTKLAYVALTWFFFVGNIINLIIKKSKSNINLFI